MAGTLALRRTRIATELAWRPEWPVAVLVVLAWAVLLLDPFAGATGVTGHVHGHGVPAAEPSHGAAGGLPGWILMSVAMMVPATIPAVRHVAVNSLPRRRLRAMGLYIAGYVGVWAAFGVVVLVLLGSVRATGVVPQPVLLVGALVAAAAWQWTPHKRRALFACRRTVPLPPLGRRADVACLRYALQQGWRCLVSCWALMVVMAVVGHASLAWMVVLAALIVAEELPLVGWRVARTASPALAAIAIVVAVSNALQALSPGGGA